MAHKMQERYEARLERRRVDVGELVGQLTEAAMRQLLERLALRSPSLMFDVLDAIEKEQTGDPDNERHHPTESVNSWCSCTNCRHMPTAAEGVLQDAATELHQQPHSVRDARIGRRCAGGGRPADAIEKEEKGEPDNEHHHPTESVNSWCSCTNCRHKIMPSDQYRVTRWRESSG